jgi:SNF2 family DNA or RNA helicase
MLTATKHQLECVQKFVGLEGCVIGDSMGVGKTLEGVLLDLEERRVSRKKHFRTLIICTKGGLSVWRDHLLDQGVDDHRIISIDPGNRVPFEDEIRGGAYNFDYYICHWHALPLVSALTETTSPKWDHIISDEAQYGKNRKAQRTKAWFKIGRRGLKRTAATGTPADNHPQDFWAILHWVYPKKFRSYWAFYDRYLDWYTDPRYGYRVVKGVRNMDEFHRYISDFYIRRLLTDVVDDMPPKTHSEVRVKLSTRQRKDYDAMHKWQVAKLGEGIEAGQLVVGHKIAMYMRLQQMVAGTCTLDWEPYEKFWTRHASTPPALLPKSQPQGPTVRIGEPSPKIDAVMEIIESAQEEDESVVVFSQFKDVVRMVEARCVKAKIPVSAVTGEMLKQNDRDAAVAAFQSRKTRVFVGTIGVAGTSITLTAAHTLIFTDRAWNPGVNGQAEDRIWRMGQKNQCRIIDMVADDTIDDEKLKRIWEKAQWVNEVVNIPIHLKDAA